jgi:hypothetical protein
MCGKKGQSLWLQVLEEHDYSTTRYIYTGNYEAEQWNDE